MPEPKWKVGDEVVVRHARPNLRSEVRVSTEYVTKVARKYFYTSEPDTWGKWDERAYEIETGRQKPRDPNYTNYLDHAYTPAEWEEKQLRDGLFDRIRELTKELNLDLSWRWSSQIQWSTARLMELQVLLEGVVAEKAVVRLD